MNHPTYQTLINYYENNLPEVEQVKVKKHLAQPCEQCGAKINHLRSVFSITATDRTIAPPAAVLQQAVALFQKRGPAPATPLQRILAALQFDSRMQLSPAAFRGIARSRQLLYSAQDIDIDLQLTPEQGGQNLIGQIITPSQEWESHTHAFVCLEDQSSNLLYGTETDSQGQFSFRQIEPGNYNLVLATANQEIAILDLAITND